MTTKTSLTYRQWMIEVDKIVDKRAGFGLDLLPDWLSRDAYENGMTTFEGAQECIDSAGLDGEVLVDEL